MMIQSWNNKSYSSRPGRGLRLWVRLRAGGPKAVLDVYLAGWAKYLSFGLGIEDYGLDRVLVWLRKLRK